METQYSIGLEIGLWVNRVDLIALRGDAERLA
jgi:hypothetical protein